MQCPNSPSIQIDSQAQCEYEPRALSGFRHSQKLFSTMSDFLVDIIIGPNQFQLRAINFSESFIWYMHDDTLSNSGSNVSNIRERNAACQYCNNEQDELYLIEPNSVILLPDVGKLLEYDIVFSIPEGGKLLSVKYNR